MKKWLMLCAVMLISLVLAACGSNDEGDNKSTKEGKTADEKAEVADDKEDNTKEESHTDEEESATDSEENEENEENEAAAVETQDFDFDPFDENIVTLQLEQGGVTVKLTYKADGDTVYEQTANNEVLYSALGVSTPGEAEEMMAESAEEFQGIEGVTHNFEYLDDKIMETLTVNFDEADLYEVSQMTGSDYEGDLSMSRVSLQQSVQMLQAEGYEIVESGTDAKNTASAESEADDIAEEAADSGSVNSGTYKVGEEIKAGEYLVIADSAGYVEAASSRFGTSDSIIFNLNLTEGSHTYITVKNGDYLNLENVAAYTVEEAPTIIPEDGVYTDGMYKVGEDIPAGEYNLVLNEEAFGDMGYLEVAKDSSHGLYSIETNELPKDDTNITVQEGQYLTIKDMTIDTN
ncbi:DUF1307 domain-containing protein [Oceanobacillus neutriphilus]|uniref:DUF1344 domain-containing protein n=1 Tax=Oceanobacillus neutriphilus TaxID=531815 RepID=A0ABQ2NQ51_9BACI|nr:DUF1307 domain-containing protein [Oceanobacillus neutriphilus]GGP08083.1 hypothetical protein GCM10011346_06710 [Oceanobacillus neutriphilus]